MQDEDAFFRDYAESHKKLSELGFAPSSPGSKAIAKESTILAQGAVGVAVAAAVVILSYIYEVRKKMKWTWLIRPYLTRCSLYPYDSVALN